MEENIMDLTTNSKQKTTKKRKTEKISSEQNLYIKTSDEDARAIKESVEKGETPIVNIGKVTYFNKFSKIVGFVYEGTGYQTTTEKVFNVGDSVFFFVNEGKLIVK